MKKPTDYTILLIGLVILIAVIAASCTRNQNVKLYYNAYSPLYDEFFVLASDHVLDSNSVVFFDDNAQAVDHVTPYVAKVISLYTK